MLYQEMENGDLFKSRMSGFLGVRRMTEDVFAACSTLCHRRLDAFAVFTLCGTACHRKLDTFSCFQSQRMADDLESVSGFELVVLTSFDAWEKNFSHHAANVLSRCGIDGRGMLKQCEIARTSWDMLHKRMGAEPQDDARPEVCDP